MFGWLTDAIRRWRRNKSRNVFRFFDGRRTRAVDPYAVWRHLDTHETFKWEDMDLADEGDKEAADRCINATYEAFSIPRFDGMSSTLTAGEALEVMSEYGKWMSDSKKKLGPGSTSSPLTDGKSSPAPAVPSSTMNLSSAAC